MYCAPGRSLVRHDNGWRVELMGQNRSGQEGAETYWVLRAGRNARVEMIPGGGRDECHEKHTKKRKKKIDGKNEKRKIYFYSSERKGLRDQTRREPSAARIVDCHRTGG